MALSADKVEKIIHSLLSSPCNFTPLLHFVLPVQYQDLHSFAEIWINPNGGEDDSTRREAPGETIHMLLVFDMEHIAGLRGTVCPGKGDRFCCSTVPEPICRHIRKWRRISGLPSQSLAISSAKCGWTVWNGPVADGCLPFTPV